MAYFNNSFCKIRRKSIPFSACVFTFGATFSTFKYSNISVHEEHIFWCNHESIEHQLARRSVAYEFHDGIHVYVRRRDVNSILILRSASSAWSGARARPNGANARVRTRRAHTRAPTYMLHVYTQLSTCTLFSLGPELARLQLRKRQGGG